MPSYIPDTVIQSTATDPARSTTIQMVCVNGQMITPAIYGNPAFCICDILWHSSKKYDLNGFPFYCDVASQKP